MSSLSLFYRDAKRAARRQRWARVGLGFGVAVARGRSQGHVSEGRTGGRGEGLGGLAARLSLRRQQVCVLSPRVRRRVLCVLGLLVVVFTAGGQAVRRGAFGKRVRLGQSAAEEANGQRLQAPGARVAQRVAAAAAAQAA